MTPTTDLSGLTGLTAEVVCYLRTPHRTLVVEFRPAPGGSPTAALVCHGADGIASKTRWTVGRASCVPAGPKRVAVRDEVNCVAFECDAARLLQWEAFVRWLGDDEFLAGLDGPAAKRLIRDLTVGRS